MLIKFNNLNTLAVKILVPNFVSIQSAMNEGGNRVIPAAAVNITK